MILYKLYYTHPQLYAESECKLSKTRFHGETVSGCKYNSEKIQMNHIWFAFEFIVFNNIDSELVYDILIAC